MGVLSQLGGDRKSLLVNLGGGVVTDLGGFVAASLQKGNFLRTFPHHPACYGGCRCGRKKRGKPWSFKEPGGSD